MLRINTVNMEEKIYKVLRKHKLPLKKREKLIIDLLDLFSVSESVTWTTDEVLNIIEENEHLDDLRMFFTEHGR